MHQLPTGPDFEKLTRYIHKYGGFFTSQQAGKAGYSVQNQAHHVQQGNWERCGRGIFRYCFYPHLGQRQDLILATLWSCNRSGIPQGVISHDTALVIHKLSTWSGHGIHMTVPEGFRRRSSCIYKVRLHLRNLAESDIEDFESYRVTTPLRTIVDVAMAKHIERIHVIDAMNDALRMKLITRYDIKKANLSPDERQVLIELLSLCNPDVSSNEV